MSSIPANLRYTESHSWAILDDDVLWIGITDYAQSALGDIVFIEMPEEGLHYQQGQQVGMIESVKTGSDIYAPVTGKVISVNESLRTSPELINNDPYNSWIYKIFPASKVEFEQLLSAKDYQMLIDKA